MDYRGDSQGSFTVQADRDVSLGMSIYIKNEIGCIVSYLLILTN